MGLLRNRLSQKIFFSETIELNENAVKRFKRQSNSLINRDVLVKCTDENDDDPDCITDSFEEDFENDFQGEFFLL